MFACIAVPLFAGKLTVQEFKHGEFQCIRVANRCFDLTIVPDSGGRIIRWHNKISNVTYADVKIAETKAAPPVMGGLLDDRGKFWHMPYRYNIVRDGSEAVELHMSCEDKERKLTIYKSLYIKADTPVITVAYKYENRGTEMVFGFDTGQRNFLLPGGTIASEDIRYFIPTTHTMRRRKGFTLRLEDGRRPHELGTKLYVNVAEPYHGLISMKKGCGLAIFHRDNFYSGNFIWKGHIENPTYEWMFGELPAGHSRQTAYDMIQVDGMNGISYADSNVLASMRMNREGNALSINTQIKFLRELYGKTVLLTKIRKVGTNWKRSAETLISGSGEFKTTFTLDGEALYDIHQTLVRNGKTVETWREALACGKNVEYEPIYSMRYANTTENLPIPGWQGVPLPELKFDHAAWQRNGFAIAMPVAANTFTEVSKIALTLGRNEYESRELTLYPAFNVGKVTVTGKAPAGLDFKFCRLDSLVLGGKNSGQKARYAKILRPGRILTSKEPTAMVLVFGGKNTRPGNYKFSLQFSAQNGKTITLPLEVTVSPAALPERKLIMLEAEGYPVGFPRARKDAAIREAYLHNMAAHGIDFFQYAGRGISERDIPTLELFMDMALSKGITRFKTARYDVSVPKAAEVKSWQRLYDFITSKGVQKKDIFVKIKDEQPVDQYPQMAATGKWLKQIGFRPFSTFSDIFGYPEKLRLLHPVFDMYQGGVMGKGVRAQRRKEGLYKPGDLVGTYTGWGTCWQSYMDMVPFGIGAFVYGHDFFHNHEYLRGGNSRLGANMVRIGDDYRPEDSLAFEGLRDGMDIANMAALAKQWLAIAETDPALAGKTAAYAKEFQRIFTEIVKVRLVTVDGFAGERMEKVSFADYLALREALLKLLTGLRAATIGSVDKYAKVTWNDHTLLDGKQSFVCTGDAKGAEIFRNSFAAYFKVNLQRPAKGVTVEFRRAPIKRSYTISEAPGKIVITAADDAGFRTAADCFLHCMDASGVWL